jgi:MFS family permease
MNQVDSAAGIAPTAPVKTPWAALIGVIATVSVFAVAQGLSYPLLSFILERQGASSVYIGMSAAMTPLGLIAGSPLIPVLVRRLGAPRLALVCAIVAGLSIAAIGWRQDVFAWFPLRFVIGLAIGPLYVLSEVWIIGLAPADRRGRILGFYTATISAGFAAGPAALTVVGTEGWPPFIVGVGAFAVCALSLALILPRLPPMSRERTSIRAFLPLAPTLLLAVFVTAAFEQAIFSLMPVYGTSYGIAERGMSALLAVLIAGNIALQVPLGFAGERFGTRTTMIFCALFTAAGCLLLPLLIQTWLIWPFALVWGATSFGFYTLALMELGGRFSGAMLVAGNAAFALFWGIGGIAGPPVAGAAMDLIGMHGLPLVLGIMCLALALGRMARAREFPGRAR